MSDDDNVIVINMRTTNPIPVKRVINGLVEDADNLDMLLTLGRDKNGHLDSRCSFSSVGEILGLLEEFKFDLLAGRFDRD